MLWLNPSETFVDIETVRVVYGARRIGRRDQHGTFRDEKAGGVPADSARARRSSACRLVHRPRRERRTDRQTAEPVPNDT